jgi:hypothetical protein
LIGSRCARFALAVIVFGIAGCGSGTTFNPTPVLTSLFPAQATAGSQALTLVISGQNFQTTTTAQWNGVNRPALFDQTTTQEFVVIFDSDLANPGLGQVTLTNPSPGGGVSLTALTLTINPPQVNGPVITSVSPTQATAGSNAPIMLTVNASNLLSTDTISFNGTPQPTTATGMPTTSLSTTIGAEDLQTTSLVSLAVQTTTANVASPSQKFQIGPASNPMPSLSNLSPASTKTGTLPPGGYLIVNGKNFVPTSQVLFNASPRPTGYLSNTQLAVAVLQSDVNAGGSVSVTVSNPVPGGGTSSGSTTFAIQ